MLIIRWALVLAGIGALISGAGGQVGTGDSAAKPAGLEKSSGSGVAKSSKKPRAADSHPAAAEGSAKGGEMGPVSMVRWKEVAALPTVTGQTRPGLAGVFAGALDASHAVMAGGTFFEGKGPLDGGERSFSGEIFVLSQSPGAPGADPSYAWSQCDSAFPQGLAYGASVTLDDGVLMIGGTDGTVCVPDVRLARWDAGAQHAVLTDYPALPKPLAFLGAGRVGSWVIVVGGTTTPDGRSGADVFGLDLATKEDPSAFVWQTLPALPAAVHFPIVVGEAGDAGKYLHVFGGRDLRPGHGDAVLTEGWRFDPVARVWSSSGAIQPGGAAAPVPLMGAAAVALEERQLLVLGGDDGELARLLEQNAQRPGTLEERESYARLNAAILGAHPGHRRSQLLYDARLEKWRMAGNFPEPTPAVTPAFLWDGALVLIGGEPAPGRRSAKVWLGELESE